MDVYSKSAVRPSYSQSMYFVGLSTARSESFVVSLPTVPPDAAASGAGSAKIVATVSRRTSVACDRFDAVSGCCSTGPGGNSPLPEMAAPFVVPIAGGVFGAPNLTPLAGAEDAELSDFHRIAASIPLFLDTIGLVKRNITPILCGEERILLWPLSRWAPTKASPALLGNPRNAQWVP